MKFKMIIVFASICCSLLFGCNSGGKSPSDIKSTLSSYVVKVKTYDVDKTTVLSQGTGFVCNNFRGVITNKHVIDNSYFVQIQYNNNNYWVDKITSICGSNSDFAVCSMNASFTTTYPSFSESINTGETVYALGYPNDSTTLSFTEGKITNPSVTIDGKHYFKNTAYIDHGSSGGILANKNGQVIGITTGSSGGEYLAIPYSDFKGSIGVSTMSIDPLHYFHKVTALSLTSSNFSTYFDVQYQKVVDSQFSSSFNFIVNVKSSILSTYKILINSVFYVNLDFSIKYYYHSSGGSSQNVTVTKRGAFTFYPTNITKENKEFVNLNKTNMSSYIFDSKTTPWYAFASVVGSISLVK